MAKKSYDIIIIGGGTAGLTAAIYGRRAGKSVLLLEGELFGGQIAYSPKVENYPGIPAISGVEFSNLLMEQAQGLGTDIELETVTEIKDGSPKTVITDYGQYECKAVIIAVGMIHRKMEIPGEDDLVGRGISYCAVCDGAFFKGKEVAVYGGGNTALGDAIFLSEFCNKVTLIHRREQFRGDSNLVEKCKTLNNIEFKLGNTISGLEANELLTGIIIKCVKTGQETLLPVGGLFIAIGQMPRCGFLKDLISLNQWGFVAAGEDCKTNIPGIFVAGDCRDKEVRQLTTAAADGSVSATAACAYIDSL